MIDRFGRDVMLIPEGDDHFRLNVTVSVSPQFFGWLTGIGSGISIAGPESVRKEYAEHVKMCWRSMSAEAGAVTVV